MQHIRLRLQCDVNHVRREVPATCWGGRQMKVGCQTIAWGPRIHDLDDVLASIKAAGFEGVEIAQPPHCLGVSSITALLDALCRYPLSLVGLAGGSLQQRIEFCGSYRPSYLYVEDYDLAAAPLAESLGFTLALHPHLFKPIYRLGDARKLLKSHPNLQFILDTAHLTIAGDEPGTAFEAVRGRLAAVHMKDWSPDYGRYSHRYAKGFTELGRGIINLAAILESLKEIGYTGWILWEQDSTRSDPYTSSSICCLADRQRHPEEALRSKAFRVAQTPRGNSFRRTRWTS